MSEQNQNSQTSQAEQISSETSAQSVSDPNALDQQGQSEPTGIPSKFAGKSLGDIVQSYVQLEREKGRLASELGQVNKDKEELNVRLQGQTAQNYNSPDVQQPNQQIVNQPDPFEALEELGEENPGKAIRQGFDLLRKQTEFDSKKQAAEVRKGQATDYYNTQSSEDPDYRRREPLMINLINEFRHIIRPEYENSAEALKLLNEASRGRDQKYYERVAVERSRTEQQTKTQEKRSIQTESSHSMGSDSMVDFRSLSKEEMEKALSYTDE